MIQELTLASSVFLINNDIPERVDLPIYIIFPSDTQLGLGFVLSSNFKPDTSRKGFATTSTEGEFNRFLLGKASQLLNLVLNYFKNKISNEKNSKGRDIYRGLLKTLYYSETLNSLEPYIQRYLLPDQYIVVY